MSSTSYSERRAGPTPAGGAYSVAFYMDEAGDPCPRERAHAAEIIEYDARGNMIHSTWGTVDGRPWMLD